MKLLLSFCLITTFLSTQALAETAKDDSCRFAESLHLGNAATEAIVLELAKNWNESDRSKLIPVVIGPLKQYKFERASVYEIGNFDQHFQEYLVVSSEKSSGLAFFFRLTYTQLGDKHFFKNILLNSDYSKIVNNGFISEPKQVDC